MKTVVPISELKQRTGQVLNKAVVGRRDVIVERYGQEYAVVLSLERYQELMDTARARARERLWAAQQQVYAATAGIPAGEVEELVEKAIQESRRERAGIDASCS